jgi:hypothetical protein
VAHHLAAGAGDLARLDGALQRLQAVLGDHVLAHAHLDADGDVGVLGQGFARDFGLGVVDVVELRHREAVEPDVGDVHEGIDAGAGVADDGATEGGKGVGAGIARRDERRRALVGDELVAGDADGGARIDVGVQVDETGRHELAGGR